MAGGGCIRKILKKVERGVVQPEAAPTAGQETEMAAVFGDQQANAGIRLDGGMPVHLERDERVVFGLNQKCWHANIVQEILRGLRGVIFVGSAETEGRRSDFIVDLVERTGGTQNLARETSGGRKTLSHPFEKTPLIKSVVEFTHAPDACR